MLDEEHLHLELTDVKQRYKAVLKEVKKKGGHAPKCEQKCNVTAKLVPLMKQELFRKIKLAENEQLKRNMSKAAFLILAPKFGWDQEDSEMTKLDFFFIYGGVLHRILSDRRQYVATKTQRAYESKSQIANYVLV